MANVAANLACVPTEAQPPSSGVLKSVVTSWPIAQYCERGHFFRHRTHDARVITRTITPTMIVTVFDVLAANTM